jgi:hypothetical protein
LPAVFLAFTGYDISRYVPTAYRMTISQTLCVLESVLSYALHLFFFFIGCCLYTIPVFWDLAFRRFVIGSWRFAGRCRLDLHNFKVIIKILEILQMQMEKEDNKFLLNVRSHITIDSPKDGDPWFHAVKNSTLAVFW